MRHRTAHTRVETHEHQIAGWAQAGTGESARRRARELCLTCGALWPRAAARAHERTAGPRGLYRGHRATRTGHANTGAKWLSQLRTSACTRHTTQLHMHICRDGPRTREQLWLLKPLVVPGEGRGGWKRGGRAWSACWPVSVRTGGCTRRTGRPTTRNGGACIARARQTPWAFRGRGRGGTQPRATRAAP